MNKVTITILALACLATCSNAIFWQQGDWAFGCDWKGNDLFPLQTSSPRCGPTCLNIEACTHYSWTPYNGGTCWLKQGPVNQDNAIKSSVTGIVCGFLKKTVVTPIAPSKGKLLWSSEFNSVAEVKNDWREETGTTSADGKPQWGNKELQYYTGNLANAKVDASTLTIQTRKEHLMGSNYTSARLITHKGFKYGVFEMRAKLAVGRGIWPAFWMLSGRTPLVWPLYGEIDIMEYVGHTPREVHGTIHCEAYNHEIGTEKGKMTLVDDEADWNLYQMEWTKDEVSVFLNNKRYFHFENDYKNDPKTWPFDHEYNILINTAVGGFWGGQQGIDDSIFPQDYVIDYVRHYETTA